MASVFDLLLDTLPIAVAVRAAARQAGVHVDQLSAHQLSPFLRLLPRTADHSVAPPPPPSADTWRAWAATTFTSRNDISAQRLWSWEHRAATPHTFHNINARSRDSGYKNFRVLDQLEFGHDGPPARAPGDDPHLVLPSMFRQAVRVHGTDGREIDLPLTTAHLHSQWFVTGGWMPASSHSLWPLETYVDNALVMAFTYQIPLPNAVVVGGSGVSPVQLPAEDSGEQALAAYGPADRTAGWVARARTGDFFVQGAAGPAPDLLTAGGHALTAGGHVFPEPTSPVVQIGRNMTVLTGSPRVLVVIALTTCRERADYEPVGVVGMARIYPHVMVIADIPLRQVHTSIRMTRPARTITLDQGNGTVPGTCCHAHDTIRSLLIADANEEPMPARFGFVPFWSGGFSYYEVDPEVRLAGQRMRVVSRDRNFQRTVAGAGVRDLPNSPQDLTSILKLPRQGEWDNIHLAPRLRVPSSRIRFGLAEVGLAQYVDDIDPVAMRTDNVVMAPFCSHDCFHTHWRWGPDTAVWVRGFDGLTPHQASGAPMVPANQDVFIETPSANSFVYHASAFPTARRDEDLTRTIGAGTWQVFMHHGSSYAQGIVSWREAGARSLMANLTNFRIRQGSNAIAFSFLDDHRNDLPLSEPAVFYWNLRYFVESQGHTLRAREWLTISQADVDRAREG